jgi:hypothetical protein
MNACDTSASGSDRSLPPDTDSTSGPPPLEDEAVCAIMRETYAAVGDDFLRQLVCRLAATLDVCFAFATGARRAFPGPRPGTARLGLWLAGEFGRTFESRTTHPVWRETPNLGALVDYLPVLRALYPGERRFEDVDERGCRVVPLAGSTGRLLGHLGVLDADRAFNHGRVDRVLAALAPRAAAEIGRLFAAERHHGALSRLRGALVRRRRGASLLTACAWCRRVRDEQKEWQEMEGYLRTDMGLELTHGICPDCLRRHQPGDLEPA